MIRPRWLPSYSQHANPFSCSVRKQFATFISTSEDFRHHKAGVARLNHGSFGSPPATVLEHQQKLRKKWFEQPDEWYYAGNLRRGLTEAAAAAARRVGANPSDVCLVENLSVACATVALHWGRLLRKANSKDRKKNKILMLEWNYKACGHTLSAYCEASDTGGKVVTVPLPFPLQSVDQILTSVENTLRSHKKEIRFAFIDHVTSQPSVLIPIKDIVKLCRRYEIEEVAVDGAHGIGLVPELDIPSIGADYYMSNLHKWAFCPHAATLLYARKPLMRNGKEAMFHPIVSWDWGRGLAEEALWTGTRDYSAMLCVPQALAYLDKWEGLGVGGGSLGVENFNREGCIRQAKMLGEAWNTPQVQPEETMTSMAMVKLPEALKVEDKPGQPGGGIRDLLRKEYGVEAAIGNFGDAGNLVRLSHAIYNSTEDYERLRDAVLDVLRKQRR